MTDDKIVKAEDPAVTMTEEAFDQIVQAGDFSRLTQQERSKFCWNFAVRLGLNPLTKPFDMIPLNGKLTIYANRTATDQLAKLRKLSIEIVEEETDNDRETFTVKVKVTDKEGRSEQNLGAVGIGGLTGEGMSNAKMKAYTKAKRRAVLAFEGLGFLDELEIESIQGKSEEAMARRSAFPVGETTSTAPVVQVAAPESLPPQVPAPDDKAGKPLPPMQPPADVKK